MPEKSLTVRDMSRHLGDGGMPLLEQLGVRFTTAAAGRSGGVWTPSELACNPRRAVQGGTFMVVLDAAMSLAMLSVLPRGEVGLSVDLKLSQPQPALFGATFGIFAEVVRCGKTLIFATAEVRDEDGEIVAFGDGSFLRRNLP